VQEPLCECVNGVLCGCVDGVLCVMCRNLCECVDGVWCGCVDGMLCDVQDPLCEWVAKNGHCTRRGRGDPDDAKQLSDCRPACQKSV
jgi:hypothetical protein